MRRDQWRGWEGEAEGGDLVGVETEGEGERAM